MSPNVEPIFIKVPRMEVKAIAGDLVVPVNVATETPALLFTAGENGSLIETILAQAITPTLASSASTDFNFFIKNGSSYLPLFTARASYGTSFNPQFLDLPESLIYPPQPIPSVTSLREAKALRVPPSQEIYVGLQADFSSSSATLFLTVFGGDY